MTEITSFLLGLLIGAVIVYLLMYSKRKDHPSIVAHVEKQQSEKQSRKKKILEMVREKGGVTNNDIETALGVSDATATNYLQELERDGKIEQVGQRGRFVSYKLKS